MNSSQNLSLWQIGAEHQRLLSQLYDYETGEVNMEIQAQLDALEPSAEKKCVAIQSWIRKMEADKREIDFLLQEANARKSAYEKEINKWNDYLLNNMKRLGIKEVQCPYFKIKRKVNPPSTEIVDESLIPTRFMRTREIVKVETKPDKVAIKEEVLKTGEQIPGALVLQKEKLEISINKI